MVTTRSHSWFQGGFKTEFNALKPIVYQLVGFDENRGEESQIEQFVRHWFTSQKQGGLASPDLDAREQHLLNLLKRKPELRELGQTPLLLCIICLVQQTESDRLPDTRKELYDKASRWLLLHWQAARRDQQLPVLLDRLKKHDVRDAGSNLVGPDQVMRFLSRVSYQAQTSGPVLADRRELASVNEGLLRQHFALLGRGENGTKGVDIFLDYCESENGLLQNNGVNPDGSRVYAFPHRSFQEYLASREMLQQTQRHRKAAEQAGDADWHDTLLFYAEHFRQEPDDLGLLLQALCPSEPDPSESGGLRLALAAELIWHPPVRDTLQAWLDGQAEMKNRLRDRFTVLLTDQQAMSTDVLDRAYLGDGLAWLDDPRPGVGTVETASGRIPQIAWVAVPGTGEAGFCLGYTPREWADWSEEWRPAEDEHWPDEQGVRIEGFWLAAYPVTVAQFAPFVREGYRDDAYWYSDHRQWRGNRTQPEFWDEQLRMANRPVVWVTWYEAVAYCRWLEARLNALGDRRWVVRLPSEREWEWAARGPDRWHWPWGNSWQSGVANGGDRSAGRPTSVGSVPGGRRQPHGAGQGPAPLPQTWRDAGVAVEQPDLYDLAGNVWEWCSTKWQEDYGRYDRRPCHKEWDGRYLSGSASRVFRGGAFHSNFNALRGASRWSHPGDVRPGLRGFRCCAHVLPDSDS